MTESACPFCGIDSPVVANAHAFALYDKFPVSRGHMLIVTRRHVESWFETTPEERQAMFALADEAHALLQRDFGAAGFNLGVNVGAVAGQTIPHVHLHLIPRYPGDTALPRGGVRGVIPGKQSY